MRRATFQNGGQSCVLLMLHRFTQLLMWHISISISKRNWKRFLFLMLMFMFMLMSHCEPGFSNTYFNLVLKWRHRRNVGGRKTKDLSLAPFVRPPAIVHCTIVICVSRDWLQTINTQSLSSSQRCVLLWTRNVTMVAGDSRMWERFSDVSLNLVFLLSFYDHIERKEYAY